MVENFKSEHTMDLLSLAYSNLTHLEYSDIIELARELADRLSEAQYKLWEATNHKAGMAALVEDTGKC